jgi:hypothetical protein
LRLLFITLLIPLFLWFIFSAGVYEVRLISLLLIVVLLYRTQPKKHHESIIVIHTLLLKFSMGKADRSEAVLFIIQRMVQYGKPSREEILDIHR